MFPIYFLYSKQTLSDVNTWTCENPEIGKLHQFWKGGRGPEFHRKLNFSVIIVFAADRWFFHGGWRYQFFRWIQILIPGIVLSWYLRRMGVDFFVFKILNCSIFQKTKTVFHVSQISSKKKFLIFKIGLVSKNCYQMEQKSTGAGAAATNSAPATRAHSLSGRRVSFII